MPSDVRYSGDRNWQVELTAFKIDLFVYKAIGTTIVARHKELVRTGLFGLGGLKEGWVERPVSNLSVSNSYKGLLATIGGEQVAQRQCSSSNQSVCDCRLFSVGIGITIPASAGDGLPEPGGATPSSAASLEVRSVTGFGTAMINTEVLHLGPVEAS